MDPNKLLDLQMQMRNNQNDLSDYLREMESWEKEIKLKEEQLVSSPATTKHSPLTTDLPPVRNSLTKKVLKKKSKKKQPEKEKIEEKAKKIRGYDYRSWDKFDVEKACEAVDKEERQKSSSSEYETDEEAEELRKKQLANRHKDEGNQYFKTEQYNLAVECYSRGLDIDSNNVLLLLNRAMAFLKQEKFGAAEQDCSMAILLGTKDAKAWFRRGCAWESLKHYNEALRDFEEVLKIDSHNKAAVNKIESIKNILNPTPPSNIIKAIYIPPEKRSKKPLRRIVIEEVGLDDANSYHKKAKTDQLSSNFDKFLSSSENASDNSSTQVKKTDKIINEPKVTEETEESPESSNFEQAVSFDSATSKNSSASNSNDRDQQRPSNEECLTHERREKEKTDVVKSDVDHQTKANGHHKRSVDGVVMKPQNSCQFQAHWKILRQTSVEFFQYFKEIDPKDYRSLFTLAFDDELLTKILLCLKEFYKRDNLDVFVVLDHLTRVQRFSTIIMFLNPEYKLVLRDLFAEIELSGKFSAAAIDGLKSLYEL